MGHLQEVELADDFSRGGRSMLTGVLALGDVEDVEKWCTWIVSNWIKTSGALLTHQQRRELVTYLIGEAWKLSEKFDPERYSSFSAYSKYILSRRIANWYHEEFGDSRSGTKRPQPISLDSSTVLNTDAAGDYSRPMSMVEAIVDEDDWVTRTDTALDIETLTGLLDRLSDHGRWVVENILWPKVKNDESRSDIAARLGLSNRKIDRYIDDVRFELLKLAGWTTPATDAQLVEAA